VSVDVSIEEAALATADETIPALIPASRPLAEAHRLDLALFVAVEEASVRISNALVHHAPTPEALTFAAGQAAYDARHRDLFRRRLDLSLASMPTDRASATEAMLLRMLKSGKAEPGALRRDEVVSVAVIPPLRRFLDRCHEAADAGSFLEAVVLFDLLLKGMACPLADHEARYWEPIDPFLACLIRAANAGERRHVSLAAVLTARLLVERTDRDRLAARCREAVSLLRESFRYYIRKLVGVIVVVARQDPERFAGVEVVPGRPLVSTPENEQVALIQEAGDAGLARALREAGLDIDGHQESISHA